MSTVLINQVNVTLPSDQVYLFAETNNGSVVYKYKYAGSNGDVTGTISESVMTALGVRVSSLPVLVYKTDFLLKLGVNYVAINDIVVANKAYQEVIDIIQTNKVDKCDFLTKLGVIDTRISSLECQEVIDNSSDVIDIQLLKDGMHYKYTKSIRGDIVIENIEKGFRGSSVVFTAIDKVVTNPMSSITIHLEDDGARDCDVEDYKVTISLGLSSTGTSVTDAVFDTYLSGCATPDGSENDCNYSYNCQFNTESNRWEITGSWDRTVVPELVETKIRYVKLANTNNTEAPNYTDVVIPFTWVQDPEDWVGEITHNGPSTGTDYGDVVLELAVMDGGSSWGIRDDVENEYLKCSWDGNDPYDISNTFWSTEHELLTPITYNGTQYSFFMEIWDETQTSGGESEAYSETSDTVVIAYGPTGTTNLLDVEWSFNSNFQSVLPSGLYDEWMGYTTRYSAETSSITVDSESAPNTPHLNIPSVTISGVTTLVGGKSYILSVYNGLIVVAEVRPGSNGL